MPSVRGLKCLIARATLSNAMLGVGWAASLGFVYRFAAVYGFGKPGKSAAAAAITLTTQGEMCI